MAYRVKLSGGASKDFKTLDRAVRDRIRDRLVQLEADPFDRRIAKQLTGDKKEFWSSRVGDWRIVYFADPELWVVAVDRIRHRREVYNR